MRRRVDQAIHEDLDLVSFADRPVHFQLEIALRSDFADIFEVRAHQFTRRGNTLSRWNDERHELRTTYTNGDFHRGVIFQLLDTGSRPQFANGRVVFDITLAAGPVLAHVRLLPPRRRARAALRRDRCQRTDDADHDELGALQAEWKSVATRLTSSNEHVYRAFTPVGRGHGRAAHARAGPGAQRLGARGGRARGTWRCSAATA